MDSLNVSAEAENLKFSANEFEILKTQIQTLKNNISDIGFEENKIHSINYKLDFLIEQAMHMNKFDWKSLFVGTIVSLIMQLSLSQEEGRQLWTLIKKVFSTFFIN